MSEDALAIAPDSFTVNGADTVFTGRQYVGLGRLDTERNGIGIFNAETDDIGILGDRPDSIDQVGEGPVDQPFPLCTRTLSNVVPLFPWGDLSARCTKGNGVLDTEDLDGDQRARSPTGSNENVFRYVVDLRADSFFVRDGDHDDGRAGSCIAFRSAGPAPRSTRRPSGWSSSSGSRSRRRPTPGSRTSSRASRWPGSGSSARPGCGARRRRSPGSRAAPAQPHGEVVTSIVSTENQLDLGYSSPPGVVEDVARRGGDQRDRRDPDQREVAAHHRAPISRLGERAEAYLRFPAGAQNLLTYRTLRVWMRGRGPGWEEGDLQAFIKLGSDNDNFYLYRAPAKSTTWLPEFVIDLEIWRRLRADVENRWLSGQPPSGAAECGAAGHDRLRRVRRTLPGARPRPRRQSAEPGGGPGDRRRDLPRGRRPSPRPQSSSGWTTSG